MDDKEDKKDTLKTPSTAAQETVEEAEETAATAETEQETAAEKPAEEAPVTPNWKDMYARMTADFDNFRKRTAREREDIFKSAAGGVLKDLLPSIDDLARALEKATDAEDPFVKGVRLVYDGLVKMLATHGATPIDSLGEPLNTDFHEAIATLPSPDVPEGHIMTEVKRGWLLNGKLLRVAQVVVSAGPAK